MAALRSSWLAGEACPPLVWRGGLRHVWLWMVAVSTGKTTGFRAGGDGCGKCNRGGYTCGGGGGRSVGGKTTCGGSQMTERREKRQLRADRRLLCRVSRPCCPVLRAVCRPCGLMWPAGIGAAAGLVGRAVSGCSPPLAASCRAGRNSPENCRLRNEPKLSEEDSMACLTDQTGGISKN